MHNVDCTRRASDRNPVAKNSAEEATSKFGGPVYWCKVPRPALAADISDSAFRVLAAIESLGRQGHCYATDEEIAFATGKSLSAVSRALRELAEAGWATRTQRRRHRDIAFTFSYASAATQTQSIATDKTSENAGPSGRNRRGGGPDSTGPCIEREKEELKSEAPRSAGPAREGPPGPTGEGKSGEQDSGPLSVEQAVDLARGACPVLAQFGRAALVKAGWTEPAIEQAAGPVARGLRPSLRGRPRPSPNPGASPPTAPPGLASPPGSSSNPSPSPKGMLHMLARSLRPATRRE